MAPVTAASQQTDMKQSTELVRIMIVTTLSHVLWYRRVFGRMRYNFKTCDPADPNTSYDKFVNDPKSDSAQDHDPTAGLTSWAIVPRHINADADKFLDHLENGVKEALENGSLSKLQLSFHSLDQYPPSTENMIESYTLGIDYKNGISLAEITAEDRDIIVGTSSFAVGDVKEQMDYFLTELNHLLVSSNASRRAKRLSLPESFRMLLSMKYVSVDDYQPVGFHTSNDNLLALLEETPLDLRLMVTTGHHSVLAGMIQTEGLPTAEGEEPRLTYEVAALPVKSGKITRQTSQSQLIQALDPVESQSPTQPKVMAEIETMGVSRNNDFNTQLIELSPLNAQQPSLDTPDIQSQSMPVTYAQTVLYHMEQSQPMQSQDSKSLEFAPFNTCECQDGFSKPKSQLLVTQDDILKCTVCEGRRHCQCYGYIGAVELEAFVCYTCLETQFPDQQHQIQMAKSLCVKRRALSHIWEEKVLVGIKDIATHLSCPTKKAGDVLAELEKEGYIQNTANKNRKKLFTFTGQKLRANNQYFNPCTGIEELAITPNDTGVEKEERFKLPASGKTTKKVGHKSKRVEKQPRIFHAPNHLTITDDASTQGTPSPHSRSALRPDSPTPVTPTSDKNRAVDSVAGDGKKRKADDKHDEPARRARVAHGTPWSLRYN